MTDLMDFSAWYRIMYDPELDFYQHVDLFLKQRKIKLKPKYDLQRIMDTERAVANYYSLSWHDMRKNTNAQRYVMPKQMFAMIAYDYGHFTEQQIADITKSARVTIHHRIAAGRLWIEQRPEMKAAAEEIVDTLGFIK